ncbi:MAG TPA: TonB family protein [Candidatus Sulfotelmatobacter sp.]|nr:TonB family protein [Candidatus Sulfotelmatobacter sp.]
MAANAEIFFEHDRWGRALAWSAGLHVAITAGLIGYAAIMSSPSGSGWGAGGGGEAIGATLVSTVPLPANPTQTQNVLANESKGLTKSEPKVQEKEPDAIPIQGKNAKIKPKKPPTPTKKEIAKAEPEEESNQVAFGEGGPVSGPYGTFSAAGAKGGFGITGGTGDFGTKYAWYVRVIQQKVTDNWLKYEVDPRITSAQRVYITFDITRDGHPANVQVEQSSGVPSLDISAVRALQRIDTFGSLPADYSGNKISVEYWFDFHR